MIEFTASLKLLLYISLIGCVFAPWSLAPASSSWEAYALGLAAYFAKLLMAALPSPCSKYPLPKMRVFRVPNLLGAALMLGLLGTLLRFRLGGF